jgi:hypothetical protein
MLQHARSRAFFLDRFQFRQCLQILGAPCGPLRPNELPQAQAKAARSEHLQLDGVRQQFLIGSSARNCAQQIDVAERCDEREIQPSQASQRPK